MAISAAHYGVEMDACYDPALELHAESGHFSYEVLTYLRDDPARIADFTRDNALGDLVMGGCVAARRAFGVHCRGFVLEMYDDPDGDDDTRLFVLVQVNTGATRALELEDRFNDEWWFDHMDHAHGRLAFGLEFV